MRDKRPELLLPAGSLEVLKVAVDYGADAVYIGGDAFSLRAKAKNFSRDEMAEGIAYAHSHGVKVHVTANILAHEADLSNAREYFKELSELGPDALIISDPGMFMLAKDHCPGIEIHVSTQANNTNSGSFNFWYAQGAKRVVCARELSLKEIARIRENIPDDMEVECFIHGAMCISYSGRCLLSAYFTGRDANRGACTHPCRWKYHVTEETRPGEYLPVEENERGTFIFNSKDLCMIEHIPELIHAGIDSFKIEGRMKTALYVAMVARTYRKAIDWCMESEDEYKSHMDWLWREIRKCTYRQYSTGFYFGNPHDAGQIYDESTYVTGYRYLGCCGSSDEKGVHIIQKNKFSVGDEIEIMKPDGRDVNVKVLGIKDIEGNKMDSCPHAAQDIWIELSEKPDEGDILRVRTDGYEGGSYERNDC